MPNTLPLPVQSILAPLFGVLPFSEAMSVLVVEKPQSEEILKVAQQVADSAESSLMKAAVWIYVDELAKAHALVQEDDSRLGAAWHAVVHRREGDFNNSYYWWRRARKEEHGDLVRRVELARGANPADVVSSQRQEWLELLRETVIPQEVSV